MKKVYKLYVDELGMSHPGSYEKSPYYILLGCIIDEQYQRQLEDHANHIKYKYWGRTDVLFHSADIGNNTKDYEILADDAVKQNFCKDLVAMLHAENFTITAAIIDKEKAYRSFWVEKTVIKQSADIVLFNFLAYIYAKMPCGGKIVIEASNIDRDAQYLASFNALLNPTMPHDKELFHDVRERLTSINFATKQNHDIGAQIADLMAYGIRCKQEMATSGVTFDKQSYEYKIMHAAETKLIKTDPSMSQEKKKYFSLIEPMKVVPKKIMKPKEKRG